MKIITNPIEAREALKRHSIPTHLWDGGNYKTIEQLMESLETDAIQLEEHDNHGSKSLILRVNVVVAHIQVFKENTDTWHKLYEHSVFSPKTNEWKSRQQFNGSVAGKPLRSEPLNSQGLLTAIQREIGEELGQTEPRFKRPGHYELVPRHRETVVACDCYPGLPEHFVRQHFRCLIHPKLYRKKYVHVDEKSRRITTFKWDPLICQEYPEDEIVLAN
ncbi:MAG TPA: hypothetical protein VL335_02315 [Candidatus Paceibacterota bacterium]|nr:hypothetical protein [Candidatus Paceibacterota bacterium]